MNTITALQLATLALRHIAKGQDDQQNTITAREALRDIERLVPHSPAGPTPMAARGGQPNREKRTTGQDRGAGR